MTRTVTWETIENKLDKYVERGLITALRILDVNEDNTVVVSYEVAERS